MSACWRMWVNCLGATYSYRLHLHLHVNKSFCNCLLLISLIKSYILTLYSILIALPSNNSQQTNPKANKKTNAFTTPHRFHLSGNQKNMPLNRPSTHRSGSLTSLYARMSGGDYFRFIETCRDCQTSYFCNTRQELVIWRREHVQVCPGKPGVGMSEWVSLSLR